MLHRREFLLRLCAGWAGLSIGSWALASARTEIVYVVKKGDTLSSIAKKYGVGVVDLRARNGLKGDTILVGQKLTVPPSSGAGVPGPQQAGGGRGESRVGVLGPVRAASADLRITPGRWTHIVIHHSGIEAGNAKSYDAGHRRRGMENGLAYHFVIGNGRDSGDGQIEVGSRWTRQIFGGHVRSEAMNEHGIGVCLVGNFERRVPGDKQLASLFALVDWLRGGALPGRVVPKVTVHRWVDRNHTVCPGKRFPYGELATRYGATAKGA